jgi:TRAP-type C4-dicarboxylate transport system substrate-binding protein
VVPPFGVFTTGKKINTVKDLRGLRIRTPGPTVGLALAKLGAIPLGMPVSMIGDAIASGTVEAIAFSMDSTLGTKGAGDKYLHEQLSVVVDMRFAAPSQMVVMSQAKWDALPAEFQAAIEKGTVGFIGDGLRVREEAEISGLKKFQADPRYTVIPFSRQLREELRTAMAPAFDDWKADMTRRGLGGDRLLSHAQELVRQFSVASN